MTDLPHDYLPEVTQIFINLGAAEESAQVMASQLLKRAEQIAEERQISKVDATETLLKQVIAARQGA
tara:strand:- start:691 stop:891 length:201 start_codon:yes stop_codon:yes gene_type:complete